MKTTELISFHLRVCMAVCAFSFGWVVFADSVDCELGLCKPAHSRVQLDEGGRGFGRTAKVAKDFAVRLAILYSCSRGKIESTESLKCPDSKKCELYGITELTPSNCTHFGEGYSDSEVDSWENVTVTDGTYINFVNQCVDTGGDRSECERQWNIEGNRYFATATAAIPVKAKRLCKQKQNSCNVPDTSSIEEYFSEGSEESFESELGSIF